MSPLLLEGYTAQCTCKKEYVFHKTKDFPGVIFTPGTHYKLDLSSLKIEYSSLVAVYNEKYDATVGMDLSRFKKHFEIDKVKLNDIDKEILRKRGEL